MKPLLMKPVFLCCTFSSSSQMRGSGMSTTQNHQTIFIQTFNNRPGQQFNVANI